MRAALSGLTAIAGIALLAGCATKPALPPVGPWAYEFNLGTFKDMRPMDDNTVLMASVPFTTDSFMKGWRNSVGRSVFANAPARLDVTLNAYEVTSSASSYALSMDVSLRGRDEYNRTIGTMNGRCNAIQKVSMPIWGDFWQQARHEGTVYPLTATARNATMWQKVMDSCVAELAKQFDTSLAAGMH